METFDCIYNRRSIRKYLQTPVEFDKISLILEAGARAPSAGNLQDYRFVLITDKATIHQVADHCTEQTWIAHAPVLIVVCADIDRTTKYYGLRGQRLYSVQNSAAAIQNMLLAAHALGLGACWIGSFDENYISDKLGIPETVRPQAVLTIGYADEKPKAPDLNPLDSFVYFNEYGNVLKNLNLYVKDYSKEVERIMGNIKPKIESNTATLKEHAKRLLERLKNMQDRKR